MKNTLYTKFAMSAIAATAIILVVSTAWSEEAEHEEGEASLVLDSAERQAAGIRIGTVQRKEVFQRQRVPGEVVPNAYKSAKVAPRITAQVVRRKVRLGEHVEKGQALVTVSSVEMADAQGGLLVADQEWQRVKSLGKDVVSGSRYTEAQVNRQRAMAKVLAYGMSSSQANRLLTSADATQATGEFDVLAPLSGTVLAEDFLVGELIEPGHVLFELSDESTLWVEARISANSIGAISEETAVRISANRKEWREAKVVQIHHRLDEVTRTQGVRIQVENTDDWLHAGQFVEVELLLGSSANALTVPVESIVLLKGDTVVFRLEEGNEFHPESVTLGATHGEDREVLEGLKEGDVFAESGAFFLKSLLLKSELGEGHGH